MAHLYYCEELAGRGVAVAAGPADVAALEGGAAAAVERGLVFACELTGDEAHHAVRVARLRAGERVLVGDGAGRLWQAEVLEASQQSCRLALLYPVGEGGWPVDVEAAGEGAAAGATSPAQSEPKLVLVQGLAKGDRAERAVELATECGVHEIVPWQAERSVSRWEGAAKAARGREKWQKIAREAAKQSLRASVPVVREAVGTRELVSLISGAAGAGPADVAGRSRPVLAAVLHPWESEKLSALLAARAEELSQPGAEVWLVVGPEGGLGEREISQLREAGAVPTVLGRTVLRTSSAGAAALVLAKAVLGAW